MQVLDPISCGQVAGGGPKDDVRAAVIGWFIGKALDYTLAGVNKLTDYFYSNSKPIQDDTMYNAMGDFNIPVTPTTADNDG